MLQDSQQQGASALQKVEEANEGRSIKATGREEPMTELKKGGNGV